MVEGEVAQEFLCSIALCIIIFLPKKPPRKSDNSVLHFRVSNQEACEDTNQKSDLSLIYMRYLDIFIIPRFLAPSVCGCLF